MTHKSKLKPHTYILIDNIPSYISKRENHIPITHIQKRSTTKSHPITHIQNFNISSSKFQMTLLHLCIRVCTRFTTLVSIWNKCHTEPCNFLIASVLLRSKQSLESYLLASTMSWPSKRTELRPPSRMSWTARTAPPPSAASCSPPPRLSHP